MKKLKTKQPKKYHIGSRDREFFISNLALLLTAAVSVGEAFATLRDTTRSAPLKKALRQMEDDVNEGIPLWQTLERSGIASSQTLALVRLGEQAGNLTDNLRVAAQQEEKQRIFASKVRSALIYPAFVMSITLVVGLSVAWFLLPRLGDTFTNMNVKLPLISKIFIDFGMFLKHNGLWAVPSFLAGIALFVYLLFFFPPFKNIGRRLLFALPGIGRLMHEVEIARFGYLFSTLLSAGLSITQALELLKSASNAPGYRRFYDYLKQSFDEGYSFREAFKRYKKIQKLLPIPEQQLIIAGERSGALADTLGSIGTIYEQRADTTTNNLEAILEPILLIIVWVGVLMVALAVILPIYSLVGGLG